MLSSFSPPNQRAAGGTLDPPHTAIVGQQWDNRRMFLPRDPAAADCYVRFGQVPPYAAASPTAAKEAVLAACTAAAACADELAADTAAVTWANVVVPLDAVVERIEREYSLIAHLHAVDATPEWDQVNTECLAQVAAVLTAIGQNAGLYQRLQNLAAAGTPALPADRQRILADMLANFELAGVGLAEQQRQRFADCEQQLAQLAATFEEHVREATAAWSEMLTDEAALGEMPADMKAAAKTEAGWQVSLLDPSYIACMTHSTDRALRQRICEARNARATERADGKFDNLPLVREIVALRWEQAKLLGFSSPAAMILSRRMASEPDTVATFLTKLTDAARPHALREIEQLREFAAAELGITELQPWDTAFVCERYKQATTGLSDSDVRPYFGTERVMAGLFQCVERLFGVTFTTADLPVWAADVIALQVHRGGEHIGHLYLDLAARPAKRGGAWAHGAMARCHIPAGNQLPTALVNCNFTAAAAAAQQQLSWNEVITLFHEAGHALHHLLGRIDDYCASGMNGVEMDAVELPSQFMENFAWEKEVAIGMSSHADTGAAMSEEMFAQLAAQRTFLPGLFVTRQLSFGHYDLQLHRQGDADPLSLWHECVAANVVTPQLADDRTPCTFGHIFAGGYATGYYGYLWADVLSADAYAMFAQDDADVAALGQRFAAAVLERGGSRDAAENFRDFRGRDPQPEALLLRLGIA